MSVGSRIGMLSVTLALSGLSVLVGCGGEPALPPGAGPEEAPDVIPALPPEGAARLVVLPDAAGASPQAVTGAELPGRGRYLLVNGAGLAFHRSDWPIHALRTRLVTDTGVTLFTWEEETAADARQPYYAYGRDGQHALGRVRETSYQVRLEGADFDPLADGAARPPQGLADAGGNLHLVQFHATPLPEFRRVIAQLGGKVLRFLPDHTYLIEMAPAVRSQVARLTAVRWIGPYHPAYRVEPALRAAIAGSAPRLGAGRYSVLLSERGAARQEALARAVEHAGGQVVMREPAGLRMEVVLDQEQLVQVAAADEVQFIDRWGGPGETDMDIVREVGGANSIELVRGWNGQGVRGEVFDTELLTTHREWNLTPVLHSTASTGTTYHGSSTYSNCFAKGVTPGARGMLPGAQGIFYRYSDSTQFGGMKSRYDINKELIDPTGTYRAVFQTSSVGSTVGTAYTTISAEVDDYLLQYPILSTQSQSNTGSQTSRPQAWAKNIVSIGGFNHVNTEKRSDDNWTRSGSIGPAADGRIKPDLSYFYDSINAATGTGADKYTQFGGTSSATPQTAGHFGLLFQMWHEGVWAGQGRKNDVFASRPQMATAKALMINLAYRYDWKAGGANADLDRAKQGWGTADVRRLYDRAPVTSVIDEKDVLLPMGKKSYDVTVAAGQTELNVTMAFKDPMGTVGATVARINDLSLRVTSPTGTVYWGNNGLLSSNESTSGGSANTKDTVENVFLKNPAAGTWKVEVLADEIVEDAHLDTGEVDAVYGLVVSGGRIVP